MAGPYNDLQFPNFLGGLQAVSHASYYDSLADKERRTLAAGPDVAPAMRGDAGALDRIAAVNPDLAMKIKLMTSNADARQLAAGRTRLELAGRLAASVLSAPPADRPARYAAALDEARTLGIDTSNFPPIWSPATEAWLNHAAGTLGSASQLFKRMGTGGGGAAPAPGGFGGPRVSAAPTPAGPTAVAGLPPPPTQMASAVPPPPAAPPVRPGAPPPVGPSGDDLTDFDFGGAIARAPAAPTGAPTVTAGAGPLPMAVPPGPPRIAPTAAPAAAPAPTQLAAADVPADDSGEDRVFQPPANEQQAREIGLKPGEMYGVDPKKGTPIVENGWFLVRTRDKGDVWRQFPKGADTPTPLGAPAAGPPDARAAVRGLQLPDGYRVAGVNGQPVVKDGTVMVVAPDGSYDFVPLPQRAPIDHAAGRWEDVRDEKGRLLGQRRTDTNEYKPIDRNAGGAGRPLSQGNIDKLGAAGSSAQEFIGLRDTFDDSFGGYKSEFVGSLDNFAKRNLPDSLGGEDPKGQVDWWTRYQAQKNLIRHTLFGSALTATEKAEFDKANVDPGMKPDKIRTNLARQADVAMRAAAKVARALEASGYNRDAIEAAIGIPLDALPSPTAKPLADTPKGAPAAGAPKPDAKPTLTYNPQTGRLE